MEDRSFMCEIIRSNSRERDLVGGGGFGVLFGGCVPKGWTRVSQTRGF